MVDHISTLFGTNIHLLGRRTRDWYIDQFYSRVLEQWDSKTYGKIYRATIKFKVSHLKMNDLKWLLNECSQSKHFSKCFFGCLKVPKVPKVPNAKRVVSSDAKNAEKSA